MLLALPATSALLAACGGAASDDDLRRAEAEYHLAEGLWQEQNVAGAFQHLEEAVRLDHEYAEAYLLLGTLYFFRQEPERAERNLREALRANETLGRGGRAALPSEAHNALGVLYIHQHRYDEAIAELRQATGDLMNRTPHLAWGNLGWAYLEKRDFSEARLALEESVRRQPLFCGGWYRLGLLQFTLAGTTSDSREENLSHADESLTHALEIEDPACRALQDAYRVRGEVRARLGRRDDAVADFERCVELSAQTEAGRACATLLESSP
jgi:type IV pilus assembly protein PilF